MQHAKSQRRLVVAALYFCAALGIASAEAPDPYLKVKVEGVAEGVGTPGRVNAIQAAERQALSLAVSAVLDTGYTDIAAALQAQPERYIQTSRLLNSRVADGETHALVEVYLRNHELRSDIASAVFPRLHPKPRILIIVAEELAGQSFLNAAAPGIAEKSLAEAFTQSGFVVVDALEVRRRYPAPELLNYIQGSPKNAARFGLENQADLILLGQAFSQLDEQPRGGNLVRISASINVSLVRSSDALLSDSRNAKAAVHAANPVDGAALALRDAAVKVTQPVMISAALAMIGVERSRHYYMTIASPGSRDFVEAIRQTLEDYPGVRGVETLRATPDEARIQFQFSGKMRPLVDTLENIDHPQFKLVPDQIVGHQMSFTTSPAR